MVQRFTVSSKQVIKPKRLGIINETRAYEGSPRITARGAFAARALSACPLVTQQRGTIKCIVASPVFKFTALAGGIRPEPKTDTRRLKTGCESGPSYFSSDFPESSS